MATINGTAGSDTLNGTAGDDEINGLGNRDTLSGAAGNDTIFGGAGDDIGIGNDGNDTLFGGAGADVLGGDAGNDTLYGGADRDLLLGGTGNDTLYGGLEYDSFFGGEGDDVLIGDDDFVDDYYGDDGNDQIFAGNGGNNWAYGGAGNDTIFGGTGSESIEGNDGDDSIYAGPGNDTVLGGNGNDLIQGQEGNDTLFGGTGADVFEFSNAAGADTVFGGSGADDNDTIRFVIGADVTVSFSSGEAGSYTQSAGATQGTFEDIETIETAGGNDLVNASLSNLNQTISTGAGNDTLSGGDGNDSLSGGTGVDMLFGGAGNDTLRGGDDNDTLTTGAGNDTIELRRSGSDDTVTDFDTGDDDSNGFTNDQLDVSELRDLGGNPINVADVTVSTGVGGFAQLDFPEGESVTLQGVTPAQASAPGALYSYGIPCFTAGACILTPQGDVPITRLRVGDLVTTRDNGPQKIRWIGTRALSMTDLRAVPRLCPIRIAPGVFGNTGPVLVSPQHGMLLSVSGDETLVRAVHLARMPGGKVRQARGARCVTYIHLMFEKHQIIYGDGIPSESFYPGPCALAAMRPDQISEMTALFPDLASTGLKEMRVRHVAPFNALPQHLNALAAPT